MIPLNEQAYFYIQDMILTNHLSYQTIYSETKLAKEIGISRTPFRDAIHRLAQEGYVDIIPSKGFQLHQLTKRDIDETFQVRSALECYSTLEITKQFTSQKAQTLFSELHILLDKMYTILHTTKSIKDFVSYDFKFHSKVIEYMENKQFSSMFSLLLYRMKRLAELSLAHEGRMEATYHEHLAILSGMESGDITHIYDITLEHMNTPHEINLDDLYNSKI